MVIFFECYIECLVWGDGREEKPRDLKLNEVDHCANGGNGGETRRKAEEREAHKKSQEIHQIKKLHFMFCGLRDYRVTGYNKTQHHL